MSVRTIEIIQHNVLVIGIVHKIRRIHGVPRERS